MPLCFEVLSRDESVIWKENTVFLKEDDWDDWFEFSTVYNLFICLKDNAQSI